MMFESSQNSFRDKIGLKITFVEILRLFSSELNFSRLEVKLKGNFFKKLSSNRDRNTILDFLLTFFWKFFYLKIGKQGKKLKLSRRKLKFAVIQLKTLNVLYIVEMAEKFLETNSANKE